MNKAFTKNKVIELDSNWNLRSDGDYGIILTFSENRQKEDKKTGELITFLFEDKYYFPRIAQALKHYATATINESDCVLDIISNSKKVYDLIEKLDKEFKQF